MRRISLSSSLTVLALVALAACDAPTTPPLTRFEGSIRKLETPAVSVTNSGGTPLVSWGALSGATSYTVKLLHTVSVGSRTDGSWSDTYTTLVGTTTSTSILDTASTWTGVSSCFRQWPDGSTRKDAWRYEVTATFPTGTTRTTAFAPVGEC